MTDEYTRDAQLLLLSDQERAALPEDGRTLLVRLLSWGEVANTPQGLEAFARGAFADSDPATVLVESQAHGGAIVGRGQALMDDGQGPVLQARISDTTAGRDLLTLYHDGVLTRASVVFKPERSRHRSDGVVERVKASLRKVAILPAGAYPSAQVLEARGDTDMTDLATEATVQAPAAEPVDLSPILGRMDGLEEAIARVEARAAFGSPAANRSELARFDSFGAAWLAATDDPTVAQELQRALADQLTDDNPGLVPPAWLSTIQGLISRSRRAVAAFGGARALPATGMEFDWPKVDDTTMDMPATAFVAQQLAEKADIISAKVGFDSDKAAIATYAGGSDISWQLLRRSSPSYREAYLRFMANVWGMVTDAAFVNALVTKAGWTDTVTLTGATSAAADALLAKLFSISVDLEDITGQPAQVVLAAGDVFKRLGSLTSAVVPARYGTVNVAGTADAAGLAVNISGLPIVHEPALADGIMLVAVREAAAWHEEGSPFVAQADDVAKLGTNVAVWSLGAPAIYVPNGIVKVTATV